ncbi:GNAT family N-acetyltransferase [Pedobacter sp. UC225_65]|uniref:GNAT family N-acetyltransferase n=1 Tax=Pedobacter sp. UC225_65 TaxID=3350173 RepID=UPI00366B4DD1
MITYQIENNLDAEEFVAVLSNSTLGERRPIDEPERIAKMLAHGNLIVTARIEGKLIGVSRSLTDFAFCTYLSDLAVDEAYQKQGIGKELDQTDKISYARSETYFVGCAKSDQLLSKNRDETIRVLFSSG